ncbi:hypothetical protein Tco_0545801 [Tanacetum coccineum]
MVPLNNLGHDLSSKPVNETLYRGIIGYLMYLTASRLDIQFSTSLCARYHANTKESHLTAVKRIFRCCANILLMKSQLSDYHIKYKMVPIFCDNTSAIAISNNLVLHSRTKHIDAFCQSTRLEYNNDRYADLPQTEAMKAELLKLGLYNDKNKDSKTLVNRIPMLKTWFPIMMVFSLLTGAKIDIGDIIYTNLVTRLFETPRKKYVAYPRFISYVLERLLNIDYAQDITLGSTPLVLSKQNFNQNSSKSQFIKLTKYMLSVVYHQASMSPTPSLEKAGKKKKSQTVIKPKPK